MEISSHRCQNDCFFFFLKTFSVGKAVEKLTLYVCLSTLNVSIVLIKLCNPGVKSRLSLSRVQVQPWPGNYEPMSNSTANKQTAAQKLRPKHLYDLYWCPCSFLVLLAAFSLCSALVLLSVHQFSMSHV